MYNGAWTLHSHVRTLGGWLSVLLVNQRKTFLGHRIVLVNQRKTFLG